MLSPHMLTPKAVNDLINEIYPDVHLADLYFLQIRILASS